MLGHLIGTLQGRDQRWLIAAVLGAFAFYVLALDQGLLLSLVQGDLAYVQNFIHEAVHDARHAAGFPCH